MSQRQPTRPPKKKRFDDVPALQGPRPSLPGISLSDSLWRPLIDALFYLGEGTRRDFSVLARQLEDSAIFENRLLHDLEALGVLELERNTALDVIHWETPTSCIGELADGSWLLTGYWDRTSATDILEALQDAGGNLSLVAPQHQAMHRVEGLTPEQMDAIAEEFDVTTVRHAALTIAQILPPMSTIGDALPRISMPFAPAYEYFDTLTASWMELETAGLPGLYRVSQSFSSSYYFRNDQDVAATEAAIVTVELGKHLAAIIADRPLLAYDPAAGRLSVPMGADLPGIYARAATMCAGERPTVNVSDRSLNYFNVPVAVAEALIGKVTS